jgi:hypothetical protein
MDGYLVFVCNGHPLRSLRESESLFDMIETYPSNEHLKYYRELTILEGWYFR